MNKEKVEASIEEIDSLNKSTDISESCRISTMLKFPYDCKVKGQKK